MKRKTYIHALCMVLKRVGDCQNIVNGIIYLIMDYAVKLRYELYIPIQLFISVRGIEL